MNMGPYMRHLQFHNYLEVCLNCLEYSFGQARDNVDILDETREENLKLIAQVYMEISAMLTSTCEYHTIPRSDIEAALKGEL